MARGAITKRISERTGKASYQIRVELPPDPVTGDRRQGSETYRTRKEAEARLATWLREIERGEAVLPSSITVGELLQSWLATVASATVKPQSLAAYTRAIEKHLIPGLGAIPAQKLTPARVQAFYAEKLAGGTGARTMQVCHQRLSQALEWAVRMGDLSRNVCKLVDPPKAQRKELAIWAPEQARAFLDCAGEWEPLFHVLLSTGMRKGEALGLRWQDVDWERGTVTIRQTVVILNSRPTIQASPKTKAGRRTVQLDPDTIAILKRHRAAQNEHRLSIGPLWEDHGLVFPNLFGRPLHPDNLTHTYYGILKASGVPRIRIHDMRHSHASWLLLAGQPVHTVSERLGHARPSITLDLYAHTMANSQDEAAAIAGRLLAPAARIEGVS
jgi:integrase